MLHVFACSQVARHHLLASHIAAPTGNGGSGCGIVARQSRGVLRESKHGRSIPEVYCGSCLLRIGKNIHGELFLYSSLIESNDISLNATLGDGDSPQVTAQLAASRLPSVVTYRAHWLTGSGASPCSCALLYVRPCCIQNCCLIDGEIAAVQKMRLLREKFHQIVCLFRFFQSGLSGAESRLNLQHSQTSFWGGK